MNFFDQQIVTRRYSRLLTVYFAAAVVLFIGLAYGFALGTGNAMRVIYNWFGEHWDIHGRFQPLAPLGMWHPPLLVGTAITCVTFMAGAALARFSLLAHGGQVLAERLCGDRIAPNTTVPEERRLVNIIEEMAIASGLPQPAAYLLKGQLGINACAIGLTPDKAVIAVTRGAIDALSRDQLQSVIAHEFSHILYGDTRLKTLLTGLLHGMIVPADMAQRLLKDEGRADPVLMGLTYVVFVGLGFITIPFLMMTQLGVLLATFTKRLVTRQRELLADAAAVQFTRNPAGLAAALRTIGGYAAGGGILHRTAREISHVFFVSPLGAGSPLKAGMLCTHPSIADRIRRLDSNFDGTFPFVPTRHNVKLKQADSEPVETFAARPTGAADFAVDRTAIAASIGAPDASQLAFAGVLLRSLPAHIVAALHNPGGAGAVLYALLLSRDADVRAAQLKQLRSTADQTVYEATLSVIAATRTLPAGRRMPLVNIAVHTLKQLTEAQFVVLKENLDALVAADSQVSLFEYGLQRSIMHHLGPHFGFTPSPRSPAANTPDAILSRGREILSCLAYWGTFDLLDQDQAYRAGLAALAPEQLAAFPILPYAACTTKRFAAGLDGLAPIAPHDKRRVIEACIACIAANGRTSPEEAECLQIIADALDCPMPPILPAG